MDQYWPKVDLLDVTLDSDVESNELQGLALAGLGGGEPRSHAPSGVRALMIAVLMDAIRCYLGHEPRAAMEAETWIRAQRHRGPFSFIAVCHTLGLEPAAVRAAMAQMRETKRSARGLPRVLGNARRPAQVRPRRSRSTGRRFQRRPRILVEVARELGLPGG